MSTHPITPQYTLDRHRFMRGFGSFPRPLASSISLNVLHFCGLFVHRKRMKKNDVLLKSLSEIREADSGSRLDRWMTWRASAASVHAKCRPGQSAAASDAVLCFVQRRHFRLLREDALCFLPRRPFTHFCLGRWWTRERADASMCVHVCAHDVGNLQRPLVNVSILFAKLRTRGEVARFLIGSQ